MSDTVNDEEQIRALVVAYAERLDAGDFDAVAALFERGELRSARRATPLAGASAVRRMYDTVVRYDDGTPRTKHVLGNLEIECDRPRGRATASCVFTVLQVGGSRSLRAVLAGRYRDRFSYEDGRWWYAERVVHPDLLGDLSMHMRGR